jgi:hypothetical protein
MDLTPTLVALSILENALLPQYACVYLVSMTNNSAEREETHPVISPVEDLASVSHLQVKPAPENY